MRGLRLHLRWLRLLGLTLRGLLSLLLHHQQLALLGAHLRLLSRLQRQRRRSSTLSLLLLLLLLPLCCIDAQVVSAHATHASLDRHSHARLRD